MKIREVIERYLSHAESVRKFCPESLAERRYTLGAFVRHLGERCTADCCADELAEWVDSNPRWKSMHTKRHKAQQVNACFNWAKKVGRIAVNPFAAIVYEEGDRRPNTPDKAFQAAMRHTGAGFRRFLLFLREEGCRPGEGRKVEWHEVDWERAVIVKEKHKSRKKTKKPRIITLTPVALAMLRVMQRTAQPGPIFRNQQGNPWTKQAIVLKWARLRIRAGIDPSLTMHGIRHQTGTMAVKNGGNLKLVSLGLGHASVVTTERYYLHLDDEVDAIRREMCKAKRSI